MILVFFINFFLMVILLSVYVDCFLTISFFIVNYFFFLCFINLLYIFVVFICMNI